MSDLPHYLREERPWGSFERFTLNERSTVKIVTVREGEAISLQTHEHRDEFWRVLSGTGFITIGDARVEALTGDEFFAPRGVEHRVEGGEGNLSFLEIALGEFSEEDITRIEDRYNRADPDS